MSIPPAPEHQSFLEETTYHVRCAVLGGKESLEWVFEHFLPLLRRQAAWRLGRDDPDAPDVDDLISDAWLVTLPRLRDIKPRDGRYTPVLLAFLSSTIRRLANDRLRRMIRKPAPLLHDPANASSEGDPLHSPITNALRSAARAELAVRLQECLDNLGPQDRTVIVLRGVEGLANSDVATELQEAPNTISKRYRRALRKLRGCFPNGMFDELFGGPRPHGCA